MLRTITLISLLWAFSVLSVAGQSPYEFNKPFDVASIGLGIGMTTFYLINDQKVSGLSMQEIQDLEIQDINTFDRRASNYYSTEWQNISDASLVMSGVLPALFLLKKEIRQDYLLLGTMYAETLLLTAGIAGITKQLSKRARPFVYQDHIELSKKRETGARYSFFSRHAAFSAATTFYAAKVYTDYYPGSKWKPLIWTGAIILPAITSYARVAGGEHFPTDVLTGYAVGALIGYFIPHFHLVGSAKKRKVSLYSDVAGLKIIWKI